MKVKKLWFIKILIICLFYTNCKTTKSDNLLEAPETWRQEVLEFPLIFARSLSYKGEEHIRFAEGWGEIEDERYFSYVFIWVLEDDPDLTVSKIESDMEIYFTGLMKMGLLTKLRFFKKLPKTITSFKQSDVSSTSFEGKIEVYDAFFKKEKILLNSKVVTFYCERIKKYIVFFRLSPKDFENPIWNDLDKVNIKFNCNGDSLI